ncbi:hypothetical protein FQB35_05895 [Crassaminicella thermophila]|uniref:Uncharacterized protein n=1 Tax=Crassaminicella thermophila TaxID=2599308 RepID=A0A5C0SHZ0_CRATE|nr:hypothetical protein FQB35_05895 [Crassaminicella thermophila]
MDRKEQIKEILYYVDNHRDEHISRNICARILGETDRVSIDDEMIRELKVKLPTTKQEEITSIYKAIH